MGRLPRAIDDGLVYHALNRATTGVRSSTTTATAKPSSSAGPDSEPLPVEAVGLLLDEQPLPSPPAARYRSVHQSYPPVLNGRTHLAYHQRHQLFGPCRQGRFRSPVIQDDEHVLVVFRGTSRPTRCAALVADPGDYRWSSFQHHGMGRDDPLPSPFPEWQELGRTEAERRRRWRAKVRTTQCEEELTAVRDSLRSGRPRANRAGSSGWPIPPAH